MTHQDISYDLIGLVEFVTPLFALLGFFALLGLKATVDRVSGIIMGETRQKNTAVV